MQDLAHWLEELGMPKYTQRLLRTELASPRFAI
jgi:hypothetical protein